MENAADALKIAFAIFVFVVAITIAFSLVAKAKSTSDYVLFYADKTNFYDRLDSKEFNRVVSISDVISTLYRYYKESLCVTIVLPPEDEDNTYRFDLNMSKADLKKLGLNQTPSKENAIEKMLEDFIASKLIAYADAKFEEEFVEIPISGIYETGEDDTEITLSPGGKKVYITYTLNAQT